MPVGQAHTVSEVAGRDGVSLALHRWEPPENVPWRAVLYYVHGIQSHAGWLFETGPALAERGVVTYALDRRGSGCSGGARGDLPSVQLLIEDYLGGLSAARSASPESPLTVLGQSFGGSVVAALVASGELVTDRLVYCTPALGQQRARHGTDGLSRILGLTGTDYAPIGLDDEDYTNQARYLEFMANDHLMLRQITERSRATMAALEQTYLQYAPVPPASVHFVRTRHDPIVDLDESARVLRDLHGGFQTIEFAVVHHYVEFSSARRDYWNWLADVVVGDPR
jgi:alpha-beta hydrolase superfamily lysophospholipase